MTDALRHRGPDASGIWFDPDNGIALGNRRLSILDLSDAGAQPMHSQDDRFVLSFNGEIYNHQMLRGQLADEGRTIVWRGHSDTETLLHCLVAWGVDATLKRCNGMFAFALWDKNRRVLTLARDRIGEKPLFYGWTKNSFVFGSELGALQRHPDWQPVIDRDALSLYIRHGYVPDPHSIYIGIKKLLPAHYVEISDRQSDLAPICYWNLSAVTQAERQPDDPQSQIAELDRRLCAAVRSRMVSDVPLGAFLSGGHRFFAGCCHDAKPVDAADPQFHDWFRSGRL